MHVRYTGLTAWRASMMMLGVLMHGLTMVDPGSANVPTQFFKAFSHLFRMEAFFAISGYLSFRSSKKLQEDYLYTRITQLSIPLLFSYILIIPIGIPFSRFNGIEVIPGDLYHLWFIVVLISVVIINEKSKKHYIYNKIIDCVRANTAKRIFYFSLFAFICGLTTSCFQQYIINKYVSLDLNSISITITSIPYFLVFYVYGYVSAELHDFNNSTMIYRLGLAACLILLLFALFHTFFHPVFYGYDRSFYMKVIGIAIVPIVAMPFSALIIQSGIDFNIRSNVFNLIARCSFVVYIFHITVMQIILFICNVLELGLMQKVVTVVGGGFTISAAIYFLIIEKSKILKMIFNGSMGLYRVEPKQ